jgi:hypothetical protein
MQAWATPPQGVHSLIRVGSGERTMPRQLKQRVVSVRWLLAEAIQSRSPEMPFDQA